MREEKCVARSTGPGSNWWSTRRGVPVDRRATGLVLDRR